MSEANFAPTLVGYTGQGEFRFWCQKVLPLVYDDSLSYYELLCKVVKYLNNVIEDVAAVETNVTGLYDAYVQLQEYVNTYFDNVDIQDEINNKLDAMARDGSLTLVLAPIIAEWLATHIQPTSPAIDNTLSVSGAGADSKTVGDKALWYKGLITNTTDPLSNYLENGWWYLGATAKPSDAPVTKSGIAYLFCFKATNVTNTPVQQWYYNGVGTIYTRRIVLSDPISVGNWESLFEDVFHYRNALTGGTNFDQIRTSGFYLHTLNGEDVNAPSPYSGTLLVFNSGSGNPYQLYIDSRGNLFSRMISMPWNTPTNGFVSTNNRIASFRRAMNKKAIQLGMTNTEFIDESGLRDNQSTANDMLNLCVFANSYGISQFFLQSYKIFINDEAVTLTMNSGYKNRIERRPIDEEHGGGYEDKEYEVIWGKTGLIHRDEIPYGTLMCVAKHIETGIKLAGVVMDCHTYTDEQDSSKNLDENVVRFVAMRELFDATIGMINGDPQPTLDKCEKCASCVINEDGNFMTVYVQQDADIATYPASMTKVMSNIVAREIYQKYPMVYTIISAVDETGGNLDPDDTISYGDLLYDAFINSVNTAAKMVSWICGEFYYLIEQGRNPIT